LTWTVLIHPLVWKEDLPKLDAAGQKRILKTIRKKLAVDPEGYGEPLRGDLAGYWKLKVEDFRVVYSIKKDVVTVKVLKVGARRDFEVYEAMIRRIPKILDF
jgi:mRNA interferase RelE/StbE